MSLDTLLIDRDKVLKSKPGMTYIYNHNHAWYVGGNVKEAAARPDKVLAHMEPKCVTPGVLVHNVTVSETGRIYFYFVEPNGDDPADTQFTTAYAWPFVENFPDNEDLYKELLVLKSQATKLEHKMRRLRNRIVTLEAKDVKP